MKGVICLFPKNYFRAVLLRQDGILRKSDNTLQKYSDLPELRDFYKSIICSLREFYI